ncbi:hypothetical protein EMCRGX_G018716 [Ephydatia muelleri]|eukprot:Em0012g1010a
MASTSNGSQPPAYDAAAALPSVAPVQQYSQQPVMMVPAPPVLGMQNPNYDGPEGFLALIITTTAVCGVLNPSTLVFGMVAIVMVIMARIKKGKYDYPGAQRYSMIGVVLSILAVTWTGMGTATITATATYFVRWVST